ncbi:MAG: D-glycero-beta-D-manno-heptose-7-phosphate kinase [Planctomycetota bacterium]|nr:D-glycero-beta-D-manno-heptose-7-phosphate kinase [Planctomycetota bacterium]
MNVRELESVLLQRGRPRVLIVGDLILDAYVSGDVARISPEAPIPILTAKRKEERLGGAGNVAANLVAMNAEVDIIGVLGDDGYGRALRQLMADQGIDTSGCAIDPTRPTILKTRMMSGSHQMLRVDWEDARPIGGPAQQALLAQIPERVRRARAVVLSDYGKGVLSSEVLRSVIATARAAGIPVLVDPKGDDYKRYRGATLVTPNRKEAEQALGRKLAKIDDMSQAADDLMAQADLDAAVITLGADGIFYKDKSGRAGHVPALARAVFDVTGAGDTVVAQLGFYLADGVPLGTAVELANQAAAITVGRLGTHAVSRSELAAHMRESSPHGGKVVVGADVEASLAQWRKDGRRIVFTNGCFDVLHVGHVNYLRFAKQKGDVLIVGVNDDASVKRLKGPTRPVNPIEDRMEMLAALDMVDAVTSFSEDTPLAIIERVTPHVLVKGEDWADKGVVGREWVESHGGVVHLAPMVPGRSTTSILERARGQATS